MDFVQRMKRALQRGRSATLPPGEYSMPYDCLYGDVINDLPLLFAKATFDVVMFPYR